MEIRKQQSYWDALQLFWMLDFRSAPAYINPNLKAQTHSFTNFKSVSWRDFGRASAFVSVAKPRGDWWGVELITRGFTVREFPRETRGKNGGSVEKYRSHSRILPATQASYFRYFTLRMCGALELVCGALELLCGALKPRCGALKPGALELWGAQTAILCSHWARRFGSFGKLKKPTLFPFASTVPLWLQRGTQQLIFELELIPNEISSQETVALKKSLLDDR